MKAAGITVSATIGVILVAAILAGGVVMHRRHLQSDAEAGLRHEIQENNDGVKQLRASIPKEIENVSAVSDLLVRREAGQSANGRTPVNIGLSVMAFTNANWQAASATGAIELMSYRSVARYAGAYFEQARLAQLQAATLESMMALSSYVGHGELIDSMTPEQARLAEVQAQLLMAHLRMMSRMSEGVQGAYQEALTPADKAA